MNILVVIREPFLDKIPNLKTLLWYLSKKDNHITVISSREDKYPGLSFGNNNIKYTHVKKRSKKLEMPTTFKLGWEFIKNYKKQKPVFCIGGDTYGNLLLSNFNNLFRFKHIFFLLEYPQIVTTRNSRLLNRDKQERKALQKAFLVITHDDFHKKFLINEIKLDANKILTLPNATFTEIKEYKTDTLQRELNIPMNKKIVLHSGGLGIWFKCKELAESTKNWPENVVLVFHTSHDVSGDTYYKELASKNYDDKVLYSTKPLPTRELDSLICSADIGIALYSIEQLEYRAELMGLAAGKVGNYLKCGLPVIATKLASFAYLVDYSCGILINEESEIANAIQEINTNYKYYSENAIKCYREIWEPSKYLNKILNVIEKT